MSKKNSNGASFNMLDHLDKLTPTKESGKYICPVCQGHNLSISKDGAYSCWDGCETEVIRAEIAPLPQQRTNLSYSPRPKSRKQRDKDATEAAIKIECEVEEWYQRVACGSDSPNQAAIGLETWCREHGYSAFNATNLLKEKLKTLKEVTGAEKPEKRAAPDQLIDLGLESHIQYFATSEEVVYADVHQDGVRRTLAIRDKAFRQHLRTRYFDLTHKSPGAEAVQQAIDTLEALAMRDGDRREVFVRLAEHEGRVYIDLADESWRAIEVSADGWRLVSDAPVRFTRGACSPMPIPVTGGRVEDLQELCQFDDTQWKLILCFLLQGFKPAEGYPILLLYGPPGAGKSTLTRALKSLIDPSIGQSRKSVGEIRDFAIHATKRHVITIDNLSGLSAEQSDILCTASTGGGHAQRTLHSDTSETILDFTNLLILNGIDAIATRGDLLSRSFPLTIHPPEQRLSETQFAKRLQAITPSVMGALLTLLSQVLAVLPEIEGTYTGDSERFVGFVELGLAVEQVMNWEPGTFLQVIGNTRDEAHQTAIESSPVGQAIQSLMSGQDVWTGTMQELLFRLRAELPDSAWKAKTFPQNAIQLSKTLTRLSTDLSALGIDCRTEKKMIGRYVHLERQPNSSSLSSSSSLAPLGAGFRHDDKHDDKNSHRHHRHENSSPENIHDDKTPAHDDGNFLSSYSKPLPSKGYDDDDDDDDEKAPQSGYEQADSETWKYWDGIHTLVRVIEEGGEKSRIRVPGQRRSQWVPTIELIDPD